MSYSFNVQAASKTEAKEKVSAEFDKVVTAQPVHAADREQHQAAADSLIDLLCEDSTQDIALSVSGSCWAIDGGLKNAGFNFSAGFVPKFQA